MSSRENCIHNVFLDSAVYCKSALLSNGQNTMQYSSESTLLTHEKNMPMA